MTRLDDAGRADVLIDQGTLTREHIDALAFGIAAFHADSPSSPRVARMGAPEVIERNVIDNFASLREHLRRYVRDRQVQEHTRRFLRLAVHLAVGAEIDRALTGHERVA